MQEIQALVRGKIRPEAIRIEHLIELSQQYPDPSSSEYKLIGLALNIVLAQHLDKALKHV